MPRAVLLYKLIFTVAVLLIVAGCSSLRSYEWREPALLQHPPEGGVQADTLLRVLGVDPSKKAALRSNGSCCIDVRADSSNGLATFSLYADTESVYVVAFEGRVISADHFIGASHERWLHDEAGWVEYYRTRLPEGSPFPLQGATAEESWAFYQLKGVDVRREYGWICEYSTAGMPPPQREATLTLLHQDRHDLLRKALREAAIEGRVYAADALLYLEQQGDPITEADRALIAGLRASADTVRTCGNMGSYKVYPKLAREVLSDSAIARIQENYEMLAEIGWFSPSGI